MEHPFPVDSANHPVWAHPLGTSQTGGLTRFGPGSSNAVMARRSNIGLSPLIGSSTLGGVGSWFLVFLAGPPYFQNHRFHRIGCTIPEIKFLILEVPVHLLTPFFPPVESRSGSWTAPGVWMGGTSLEPSLFIGRFRFMPSPFRGSKVGPIGAWVRGSNVPLSRPNGL